MEAMKPIKLMIQVLEAAMPDHDWATLPVSELMSTYLEYVLSADDTTTYQELVEEWG